MNTQTWSVGHYILHYFFFFIPIIPKVIGFTVCVCVQEADAAGSVKDHRGSDEEATGNPKKRQLCRKFSIYNLSGMCACFKFQGIFI